jgi:MoxR-like ATPase
MPVRDEIDGREVWFAEASEPPKCKKFVGREKELALCRAAWGCNSEGTAFEARPPLSFRLEGPPGVGKNEIVYELARSLGKNLYIMHGHEEYTPEDLALVLVPGDHQFEFRLQGSPLAAALRFGGLCFFDEINRVPPRALSPLASVLDSRNRLDSAMAGIGISPRTEVRSDFRFCCAMNPAGDAVSSSLPQYIDERTLPVIRVEYPDADELFEIVQANLAPPKPLWDAFQEWYSDQKRKEMSARQALSLIQYAINATAFGKDEKIAIEIASAGIFREQSEKRT